MKRILIATALLMFIALPLRGQDIQLRASVDSTQFLIGEWIPLHLEIEAPAEWKLRMPADDEGFANAEFVSAEDELRQDAEGVQIISQDVVVTVFDTGRIPISAIVRYRIPGDTATHTVRSEPVTVTVQTVELDTTITYKDIREVMHVSLTLWDYLMYAGIAVLLALLAWLGYRWLRDRDGESDAEVEPEPDLPPDVIALRDLARLREERLWQNSHHKQYQSRLMDILRAYIERRFSVPALEHPTSEIMPEVAMLGLDTGLITELEHVLRIADMCKFARYIPGTGEHENGMRFAERFVEETRAAQETGTGEGGDADV